ncbi:OLC1v1021906C1 [Oldenlandia corymbosa var. corymbosa]|uniref:gibberellin 2beta-dioxygenase n=1 Tax=Oldenlandia corymbosa var. corymbosa TaxID=529605 RepID=A0AAV1BWP3_OLDCO|nr:OLC1v1021906C1 [Oldenlandia corymbosa var. corymbosa]
MLMRMMEEVSSSQVDPPFLKTYNKLFDNLNETASGAAGQKLIRDAELFSLEQWELPLIDLEKLNKGESQRAKCKDEIAKASKEWGFFQVINHGIPREILEKMRSEQIKAFRRPFHEKVESNDEDSILAESYKWGTPSATCLDQLSWSEAYHVPLSSISASDESDHHYGGDGLRSTMKNCGKAMSELAHKLAEILAENLGHKSTFFRQTCLPSTCYLRMNRYPPCPISPHVSGLMPHTDSDFITVLHQDQIGGLQLVKDGKWIAVKPNPDALIINIGDLFQAWSNGVYKSVEHRVVTNMLNERFSLAFFLCPSYETVIKSCVDPAVYRRFSFKEYRDQVQDDVKKFGHKVGLPRFLAV